MAFYVPLNKDGKPLRMPVQYLAYRFNAVWPLQKHASFAQRVLKLIGIIVSLSCYMATIVAEVTFMSENFQDIPALVRCFSTSLMGMQYLVRIFVLYLRQRQMRELLDHFYKHIFFEPEEVPRLTSRISRITSFVSFWTKVYYIPLCMIVSTFLLDAFRVGIDSPTKPFIYAMKFRWYNAQSPVAYIITALYTGWLTPSCVSLMAAEDYMLCIMLCHTSYRFKQLQNELANLHSTEHGGCIASHHVFRAKLYAILRREQKLHCFVAQAKSHFTHQIFYCLIFGVLSLCVVTFQLQRTSPGIELFKYAVWLASQTAQIIMIGFFGEMLKDESLAMQNAYYTCQWEKLLRHGTQRQNRILMLDIKFALLNTSNAALEFDGMKMISLNHTTTLRTAVSYFMFLNTMNDANTK